jgi:hypothetical protein
MPVLSLPALHLPAAWFYLEAAMLHPREPEKHQELVDAVANEAARRLLNKGRDLPPETIRSAATGPRIGDLAAPRNLLARSGQKAILNRAEVASQLFLYVLSCASHSDPQEPATLEHAYKMISTAGEKYGTLPGFGRSQLVDIFSDFAPSIHLITARSISGLDFWHAAVRSRNGAVLAQFLANAEMLRQKGEAHKVAHSKTPLLDPDKTWRVPDWIELPAAYPKEFPKPADLKAQMANWPRPY